MRKPYSHIIFKRKPYSHIIFRLDLTYIFFYVFFLGSAWTTMEVTLASANSTWICCRNAARAQVLFWVLRQLILRTVIMYSHSDWPQWAVSRLSCVSTVFSFYKYCFKCNKGWTMILKTLHRLDPIVWLWALGIFLWN